MQEEEEDLVHEQAEYVEDQNQFAPEPEINHEEEQKEHYVQHGCKYSNN